MRRERGVAAAFREASSLFYDNVMRLTVLSLERNMLKELQNKTPQETRLRSYCCIKERKRDKSDLAHSDDLFSPFSSTL